ncbi:hypothetical protein FDB42_12625 [Clostridium botulinum]|nr:hypothetical protein [Clostridium botulinum]NFO40925.1 hypothetical protein [Clostridium botulinum]
MSNESSYEYLRVIEYINLENWSFKHLYKNILNFNTKYNMLCIRDILRRNKTPIMIKDNQTYKRVTIKTKNGGIHLRDEIEGKKIGTKKQFIIKKGQFLLSKIDARNGAFGVVPSEVNGGIITGNFWAYDVDLGIIDPCFLSLVTTTKAFIDYCNTCSSGTTGRHYLQEDLFLDTKIPIPDLGTQKKLIYEYNKKINSAITKEQSANDAKEKIDNLIFAILGIERKKELHKNKGLTVAKFKNMKRWGVEFLRNNLDVDKMLISNKFTCRKLSDIVDINPMTKFDLIDNDTNITFLPMECISDENGEIVKQYEGYKSQSKGYTKFKEGDLLWAKITPCMENGKSAIAQNLYNNYGYGSTEYHVLRKKSNEEIKMEYIYYILRTKFVREQAKIFFTGSAGQQRVPDSFLKDLIIPVPQIEYQKKIVRILNNIKKREIIKRKIAIDERKIAISEFENNLFNNNM